MEQHECIQGGRCHVPLVPELPPSGSCAAFRELYCEVINPARPLMFWDANVRARGALFAAWRRHMMALVQEASTGPPLLPCREGPSLSSSSRLPACWPTPGVAAWASASGGYGCALPTNPMEAAQAAPGRAPACVEMSPCLVRQNPVPNPAQVKARGEPAPDDVSIAAHLLRLRDPTTGRPLPDDLLAGEFGVFFGAGVRTRLSWRRSPPSWARRP